MLQGMLFLLNGELSPILGAEPGVAAASAELGQAVADTETGAFNMFWMYGIWALVIVGFYFLTIRPQRKRDKQMKEMQSTLKVGENVLTSGGMYGRIADVGQDCFLIEFGTNRGVRIPIRKSDVLCIQTPTLTQAPVAKAD